MRRLREFDRVTVTVPDDGAKLRSGCFECDVVAMMGSTVAIDARDRTEVLWLPDRVHGAFMSFLHGRELVGLKGALATTQEIGDLRFVVTDGVQLERRAASRLSICAPITVRQQSTGKEAEGVTVNVSADGILAATVPPLAVGDVVEFVLSLPGVDDAVEAVGAVSHVDAGTAAIELGADQRPVRLQLGTFVLEQNRAALRCTRPMVPEAEF